MMPINVVHGTTIIVIKNKDGIFIGADSKVQNRTELDCKISQVKNLFFGFTHYKEIVHPLTGIKIFDAVELATKAGNIKGTIKDKVNYFDKLTEAKLTEVLKIWCSIFSRDEIRERLWKNILTRAIIIGVENNKPIVLERSYSVNNFDEIPLRIKTDKFTDEVFPISLGIDSAIFPDIERPEKRIYHDPVGSIKSLITRQASSTPDKVGPPIDILHIAPGKVEWIQHKRECPEIKTEYFQKSKK
jgi:hypothetical protein